MKWNTIRKIGTMKTRFTRYFFILSYLLCLLSNSLFSQENCFDIGEEYDLFGDLIPQEFGNTTQCKRVPNVWGANLRMPNDSFSIFFIDKDYNKKIQRNSVDYVGLSYFGNNRMYAKGFTKSCLKPLGENTIILHNSNKYSFRIKAKIVYVFKSILRTRTNM